jgi:acetylornithine deacetylase/succinyl-diaminopimelate desuccinylase-like protein
MKTNDELRQRIHASMPQVFEDLRRLVSIPSIANGILPKEHVLDAADVVMEQLQAAGFKNVRQLEVSGDYPAIYGEIPGPAGAPTVLLYAHYDVQLPDPQDVWHTPPFELIEEEGRLYGRGAADDKSGVVAHIATLRAFDGQPPVGVKIIVEGEEEFGDSLEHYVLRHPQTFQADVIIVADMGNIQVGEPTFTTALRGEASLTVEVRSLQGRVHSGLFGGPAPDALMALIRMLATLHDARGNTTIQGLRSGPWQGADMPEALFRQTAGVLPGVDLIGEGRLADRLWASFSVNVIGMDVPTIENSSNVLLDRARARISLRIPAGNDADKALAQLARHLESVAPWHVNVHITDREAGAGYAVQTNGPIYKLAGQALKDAYGKDAVQAGTGGSIPLVNVLARVVPQAEILIWGAEDTAARIHAPNESVDKQELERLILTQAFLLNLLSQNE